MAKTDKPQQQPGAGRPENEFLVNTVYVLAGIVGAVVLTVSSAYLHDYAVAAAMVGWLSWTLVIALDVGGVIGGVCWLISTGPARVWGRGIAAGNLAASVLGNVLGHILGGGVAPIAGQAAVPAVHVSGPWLQILTGVAYPVELAAVVHLVLLLRAERGTRHTHGTADSDITQVMPEVPGPSQPPVPMGVVPDPQSPLPVEDTKRLRVVRSLTEPVSEFVPISDPVPTQPEVPGPVPTDTPTDQDPVGTWPDRVGDITDQHVHDAGTIRDRLIAAGQKRGWDALRTETGVPEKVARELVRRLNTVPDPAAALTAASGGTR